MTKRKHVSDHEHECRTCGLPYTRCPLDNEACIRQGSPTFNGACDLEEDQVEIEERMIRKLNAQ